jgi:zinc protease
VTKTIQLDIQEQVLDSGLTLLAVRNPGVATYACVVSLDVRGSDEAVEDTGLANLVGECLDEGSRKHDALEFSAAVESIGGAAEGNLRGGSIYAPAEFQKDANELLRELVLEPAFPGREVRRVQGEILTEILADDDDPRVVAGRRFRHQVYGDHPLGRQSQGTRKVLMRLKPKHLRDFHDEFFRPVGGFVAASGPDDPARMLAQLRKTFGKFKGKAPKHPPMPEVPTPKAPRDIHLPMAREQVHVYLGHVGIRRTHPDFYALSVMDHVLGTGPGFTSRCSRKLRDEQGLCYAVSAGITASAGEEPGAFTAYIGTSPEHRQRAIDGFLAEIRRIREEPPTAEELADVQAYLTGSFVFALERNANLAAYAIRARRFQLGFDYLHRYPELIRSVTREQVQQVSARHLHPEAMVCVSAGAS